MIDMLPFNLPNLAGPTVTNYSGQLNTQGFGGSQPQLAGSYFDKDRIKQITEMFGPDMDATTRGLLTYKILEEEKQSSPKRLKEQLEVLGPYLKDVARENQRLAMEANLFAGIMDIPNKFSRAMAEQYRYFPETMEIVGRSAQPRQPLQTRQYINL